MAGAKAAGTLGFEEDVACASSSSLCFEPQKTKAGCNPTRLVGESVFFRRDSGEVVKLESQ